MLDDGDVWIEAAEVRGCCLYFGASLIGARVKNLPLKVGSVHKVEFGEANGSHSSARKVETRRRAQPTHPNDQNASGLKAFLTRETNLGQ
jgi:hypothetical protein